MAAVSFGSLCPRSFLGLRQAHAVAGQAACEGVPRRVDVELLATPVDAKDPGTLEHVKQPLQCVVAVLAPWRALGRQEDVVARNGYPFPRSVLKPAPRAMRTRSGPPGATAIQEGAITLATTSPISSRVSHRRSCPAALIPSPPD